MRVLLLDMDGVLVLPRGYRAAILETMKWFYRRWGWHAPLPEEGDIAAFEAHGITSEWDMVPLMLAWVAEAFLRDHPPEALPPLVPEDEARRVRHAVLPPPFRLLPPRVTAFLRADRDPASAVYLALKTQPEATPFPRLAHTEWAEGLLAHTREVLRAPTTRLFQQFALGSRGFEETYGVPPEVRTPSLLVREDVPLLKPEAAAALWAGHRTGRWRMAVFTRRPTRPEGAGLGFPPEAELVLERIGLPEVPILGQGHLALWAARRGLYYEAWMKPAPTHVLAALLVALDVPWEDALDAAYRAFTQGRWADLPLPRVLDITVLEDAAVGIQAVQKIITTLREQGWNVQGHFYGLAEDATKRKALEQVGAQIVPDPNTALRRAGFLP